MKLTKKKLKQIIKEETQKFLNEDFGAVQDYLFNLPEDELIMIAAQHLGEEPDFLNYEYATQWVDGLSAEEAADIYSQMSGE